MGDLEMATFDDADWSEDSRMDECDPGGPLAVQTSSDRTTQDIGKPDWDLLFSFILARMRHLRFLSTVYVLVDNRDLTNLDNPDPSLQHWPAVAAWW